MGPGIWLSPKSATVVERPGKIVFSFVLSCCCCDGRRRASSSHPPPFKCSIPPRPEKCAELIASVGSCVVVSWTWPVSIAGHLTRVLLGE